MNDIARRISEQVDRQLMGMLTGTTAASQPAPEPFTAAKLQKLMASMPPKETWLSTRLFPDSNALVVEGSRERFTVAHPAFWTKLRHELRRSEAVEVVTGPPPLFSMNLDPIEIDPWPEDSPETAKWRAAHWDRLREAIEVAMIPLPEWLRSAPKFGKHG